MTWRDLVCRKVDLSYVMKVLWKILCISCYTVGCFKKLGHMPIDMTLCDSMMGMAWRLQ